MNIIDFRDRLINLDVDALEAKTLDELINRVIEGTDWDFAESRAMFLRNFRTELPDPH